MAKLLSATSKNGIQKTLAAELLSTASTGDAITFADVDGIPNLPGVLVIDRIDSAGTATPAKREYIEYSGTSGTTVLIQTRNVDSSGTVQTHAVGAIVEFVPDVVWADRIYDALSNIVNVNDVSALASGITLSSPTLLSPNLPLSTGWFNSSGATITGVIDDDTMATASATTIATSESVKAYVDLRNNAPEGFLINGKIVPSVASNNLTVAIKGLDGNDPSASNPVYIMLGGVLRSITSALSVTKNAGTNWCNAGGAELATKEVDYFVYLGYNATDGVTLGFSRIPYANIYSDFSTTSTDYNYCAISTITNAAAGDNYAVIGRFAATLSAGAGYTWTVPTFTTKNLVQRPIFETRWLEFSSIISGSGGSIGSYTATTYVSRYKIRQQSCIFRIAKDVTNVGSWSGAIRFSYPISKRVSGTDFNTCQGYVALNAAAITALSGLAILGAGTYGNFTKNVNSADTLWSDVTAIFRIDVSAEFEIA